MINIVTMGGLFLEGLLSFFSPCVLPLIPLYLAYLTRDAKTTDENGNVTYSGKKTMYMTLCFVLGICTVFVIAGLGSGALHAFFTSHQLAFEIAGGVLLILFGLVSLDVIRIPALQKTYQIQKRYTVSGGLNAFLTGFFFSFAWSPCIGPMLANAILAAATQEGIGRWLYIGSYALGFILVFLLCGLFTSQMLAFFQKRKDIVKYTGVLGGIIVICFGAYMLYDASKLISAYGKQNEVPASEIAETPSSEISEDAPDMIKYDFTVRDKDGNAVRLSDYMGKKVLLNFYGTWCYYCNMELPDLQKLHETDDSVTVLLIAAPGVNGEGDVDYVEKYMADKGYTMTILYDETLAATTAYGISGYPTTFLINSDGSFYGYLPGYMDEANMMHFLSEMH